MGVFENLERKLEGAVNGAFARTFRNCRYASMVTVATAIKNRLSDSFLLGFFGN